MSYSKKPGNRPASTHESSKLNQIWKAYIQTVNSAILKFNWKNKNDKIKRRVMISHYDKGYGKLNQVGMVP